MMDFEFTKSWLWVIPAELAGVKRSLCYSDLPAYYLA